MNHSLNCCVKHGCTFGDDLSCPVWLEIDNQGGPCDQCNFEASVITKKMSIEEAVDTLAGFLFSDDDLPPEENREILTKLQKILAELDSRTGL